MKLFEYEAKALASNLGITVPKGGVASTPEEARDLHKRLGGSVVVKAQVLVAGRGKAGGIKFADKPDETLNLAKGMLGDKIKGETVRKLLVEQKLSIKRELYLSIAEDRLNKCQTILASGQGGIDIEEVARSDPNKIARRHTNPVYGLRGYEARDLVLKLGYQ
ncbi:MAG TPA: ATP-grasp domain-containing protein, partial [Candidatus Binatus sp.]|nr:ATP-grasp domain-containing protein [Candidatus Binatus sp.]